MYETLPVLTPSEARVLGVLIEKALSTPEYYPLTLNALVAGCNQKSNRDPVVAYTSEDAQDAADLLCRRGLATEQSGQHERAVKYRTNLGGAYDLSHAAKAVVAELLLRGPQTAGELRQRCSRMHAFASVEEVQAVLDELAGRDLPLVASLPGRREPRWMHRLSGEPDVDADEAVPARPATPVGHLADEVAALREENAALRDRLDALEAEFRAFRDQFG
ncbi:MAG: YceH family protein [Rhodothermales bacterium]|nr:YceH family protein [Rhodothermales bacterium]